MNRKVLSLFFCILCFFKARSQMNYSFASVTNEIVDSSNTDLPSNPPLGEQKSVIFSEAGFEYSPGLHPTLELSKETPVTLSNISTTGSTTQRGLPFVIGSNFMTPSAWGNTSAFAFASISGTPYQTYESVQRQCSDFLAQVGLGFGNSEKVVSVNAIVNINDVSAFDNFSYSFMVCRKVGKLSSLSVGALHMFADAAKTDAEESYYMAYSHAIVKTKFSYTIGIGSGKFYENNELDKKRGRTAPGTAIFANLSYNIFKNLAVSTEWTGRNIAVSSTLMVKPNLPVLALGFSELTRRSGDHAMFFISIAKGLTFNKGRSLFK